MDELLARRKLNDSLKALGWKVTGDVVVPPFSVSDITEIDHCGHAVTGWIRICGMKVRLERFRKNPIVLFAHSYDGLPVARSLWERIRERDLANTVEFKAQFHLQTQLSRDVWRLIESNMGNFGAAFGLVPEIWHEREDGKGPILDSADLLEISFMPKTNRMREVYRDAYNLKVTAPTLTEYLEPRERLGGRLALQLRQDSWKGLFEVLHAKETRIEAPGNFWAAVQELERQFENKSK